MELNLKDFKKGEKREPTTNIISVRLPLNQIEFIKKNNIDLRKLIAACIDEIEEKLNKEG